jgi:hypothetical protein
VRRDVDPVKTETRMGGEYDEGGVGKGSEEAGQAGIT